MTQICVINHRSPYFGSKGSLKIYIFVQNCAFFTLKSPSINQKSLAAQGNAVKKKKIRLPRCAKLYTQIVLLNQFQVKIEKFEFKVTVHYDHVLWLKRPHSVVTP